MICVGNYSKRNKRFVEIAKKVAEKSSYKTRHGAVLVKGGSVINFSHNCIDYCAFGNRFRKDPGPATIHAELGAILGIDKSQTNGATLYVVRLDKNGKMKLSKPCEMCYNALRFVGVKKVIYSIDENHVESCKIK